MIPVLPLRPARLRGLSGAMPEDRMRIGEKLGQWRRNLRKFLPHTPSSNPLPNADYPAGFLDLGASAGHLQRENCATGRATILEPSGTPGRRTTFRMALYLMQSRPKSLMAITLSRVGHQVVYQRLLTLRRHRCKGFRHSELRLPGSFRRKHSAASGCAQRSRLSRHVNKTDNPQRPLVRPL